jgi:hypothetical protein
MCQTSPVLQKWRAGTPASRVPLQQLKFVYGNAFLQPLASISTGWKACATMAFPIGSLTWK